MAKFKPYKIESSELASLEREEGQFIVTTDTQKIYLDSDDSNRIELGGKDGTVTSIATGAGLTGGTITNSGTIKANLKSETKSTLAAADMGSTANRQYAVGIDKNDKLSVNIPWTDNNTTYSLTQDGSDGHKITLTPSSGTAQTVTIPDNNTTYTFATGDNNGEIKVTPSGGSAQGVAVKGLNNAAYKDTDSSISAASTSTKLPTSQAVASFVEGKGYTTNTGTITGVSVNGTSVATSGTANITSVPASILTGAIPSAVTATTQSQGDNSTKIATTAYVDTAIDNLPEPMVFKGSLGTGGTITSLPVDGSAAIGDTYKVITDGTYASKAAKVGDTFICLTKTSNANTWELIPSGDEPSGTVTSITLNATSPIAIDNNTAITTSGSRTISHANSGVTAGTYKSVTVNTTGHITAGSNPTTISGYGITDAKIDNGVITLGSNSITPLTSEVNSNLLNGSETASLRGIGTTEESNDYTIGSYAFAEGCYTEASGFASHAEGSSTKATHEYCHVEGCMSEAYGGVSHAEGWNTRANAGSHAEGNITRAIAYNSHTEGSYSVTAGGYGAHAEGNGGDWDKVLVDSATISSINDNVITLTATPKETFIGCYAQLSGSTSTGFGYSRLIEAIDKTQNTITFISQADLSEFSVGNTIEFYLIGSTAVGNASHAEGSYTHAVGDYSHAEGGWTTAASDYQHAQGKYNILDLNSTYSDIIGNGTSNSNRSNAATVDWSGNAWYAGDVYVGSTSGINKDSGSVKLAKVSELRAAGTGLSLNGSTINHSNSITAATAGTSSATSGSTLDVPYVTYDAQGHITASGTHTHTISGFATTDTKNTAGTTNTTDKIYLAGGKSQGDNPQTYSNINCYASGGKLYSNAKEVVNLSDTQSLTNKTYDGLTLTKATTGFTIAGGTTSKTLTVNDNYTLGAACVKAVDSSISAASTSTNLPTSQAVASFVEGKGYVTTNTTYTLSADTTNNKITLTPNSGTAQSITVPYATSAGTATATSGTLTIQKNGTSVTTFNGSTATANITVPTVYTGTTTPSASTGSNGDIYIQTA